jgi:hypothetical protein
MERHPYDRGIRTGTPSVVRAAGGAEAGGRGYFVYMTGRRPPKNEIRTD